LLAGETPFNHCQVNIFIFTVDFVPNDRMPAMGEVNSDLVFSTREKVDAQQGEITFCPCETALDPEPCLRRGAVRTDTIFDGDPAGRVFAKRHINHPAIRGYVSVHDREVFRGGAGLQIRQGSNGFRILATMTIPLVSRSDSLPSAADCFGAAGCGC
jgi:hypothetical protein